MKLVKKFYRILFVPNYNVIFLYKLMVSFYNRKLKVLATIVRNRLIKKYGIFIGFNSKLGKNINFPHPQGIIIGEGVIIGDNCTIYHQVTLGQKKGNLDNRTDYPIIGNNVTIFAGAKIIGNIKIGDNSVIGANSVVTKNVEPNSVYVGIPAKKIRNFNFAE